MIQPHIALRTFTMGSLFAITAGLIGANAGFAAVTDTTQTRHPKSTIIAAKEARRLSKVPTPQAHWVGCPEFGETALCAMVKLPMDYDKPSSTTTQIAVLKLPARKPAQKLGSLFINPGGPGGSGVQMAAGAPYFISPQVLDSFDIVGFDPRGINYSDQLKCWPSQGDRTQSIAPLESRAFPWTAQEKMDFITASTKVGPACASAQPLAGSMSTAEVARDMEMLRRMLDDPTKTGDDKLNYLGFSYGTYLGTSYAAMFPDNIRSMALDGVVDPVAWTGTANPELPQTMRLKSGQGANAAMNEILKRCTQAGPHECSFAAEGDPVTNYNDIMSSLRKQPLVVSDPAAGYQYTIRYSDVIASLLSDLYRPYGSMYISANLSDLYRALHPGTGTTAAATTEKAKASLAKQIAIKRAEKKQESDTLTRQASAATRHGFAFPYNNSFETFTTVMCTDGLNPSPASGWKKFAAQDDHSAPGFGPLWTWASAPCAGNSWKISDEDSVRGPFSVATAQPILVVGNYWDPATNYASAQELAQTLPHSRLLSSDSWGHTAYGTSTCVTSAMDNYLVDGTLPAVGTTCVGNDQPFTASEPLTPPPGQSAEQLAKQKALPPVQTPLPAEVLPEAQPMRK